MEPTGEHLDLEILTQLKDIMEDEFAELVDSYIADGQKKLELLEVAVANGDANAVRMESHSFKGSSRNLGAVHLGDLLAQVEVSGADAELSGVPELLLQIQVEFELVKTQLTAMK